MKCLFNDACSIPAEFCLYSKKQTFPIGEGTILYTQSKTYLCAAHMRKHLKEIHEAGEFLFIDRLR